MPGDLHRGPRADSTARGRRGAQRGMCQHLPLPIAKMHNTDETCITSARQGAGRSRQARRWRRQCPRRCRQAGARPGRHGDAVVGAGAARVRPGAGRGSTGKPVERRRVSRVRRGGGRRLPEAPGAGRSSGSQLPGNAPAYAVSRPAGDGMDRSAAGMEGTGAGTAVRAENDFMHNGAGEFRAAQRVQRLPVSRTLSPIEDSVTPDGDTRDTASAGRRRGWWPPAGRRARPRQCATSLLRFYRRRRIIRNTEVARLHATVQRTSRRDSHP